MAKTTKKFTYDIPDDYLLQTNKLGLTAEWTYEGPDKVYVMILKDTKKINPLLGWMLYEDGRTREENDAAADTFSGLNYDYALIDVEEEPLLLAAVVGASLGPNIDEVPHKTYTLDGETEPFYSRPNPPLPHKTIEVGEVEFDFQTKEWKKPFPWKKPHITKEQLLDALEAIKELEKAVDTTGFTSTQKTKWAAYLTALDNVTIKFKDYLDTPWMVPFPTNPMHLDNWSASKGNLFGVDTKTGTELPPKSEGPVEYVDGKPHRDGVEIDISTIEPSQLSAPEEENTETTNE